MSEVTETELATKAVAPRVTQADVDAAASANPPSLHVFEGSCLTVCVLTLPNGFTVTGESACASPENFDAEIGARLAFNQAKNKIWPLMGYALKQQLHEAAELVRSLPDSPEGWKTYSGTKQLHAMPMTRGDYNAYRGWATPANENPADPGYIVEYLDGGKANDSRHAGYISWSPADVFERAYRLV